MPEDLPGTAEPARGPCVYPKSPFAAGMMSFFLPGAGQFYNGQIGKGALHLGVFSGAMAVLILDYGKLEVAEPGDEVSHNPLAPACAAVAIALYIWSPWDAYATAKRINQEGTAAGTSSMGLTHDVPCVGFDLGLARSEARAAVVVRF